ncbi:MAG TPA: acetylxylan esterase [Pseudonocardiaceae bacterium]
MRLSGAIAALVLLGAGALAGCVPQRATAGGDLPDLGVPGPHQVLVSAAPAHTFYAPAAFADGARYPVVLWGNGTGAAPTVYDALLRHLASHGFLVAAANTPRALTGAELLTGLDQLTAFDRDPGSRFHGHVDATAVGATGHSQGGGGALNAARDPRVRTAAPLQPWRGEAGLVRGSVLLLAGGDDRVVPPADVRAAFDQVTGRGAYAELRTGPHTEPARDGGRYRAVLTAWLLWTLRGDERAGAWFTGPGCGLCRSPDWTYQPDL